MADDDQVEGDGIDEGPDPFEGLTLDDDFVRSASVVEESAAERLARLAAIDAEHKRLAAEREVRQRELDKTLRRNERKHRRAARGNSQRQRLAVIAVMLAVAGGLFWWNVRDGGSQSSGGLALRGDATGGTVISSARPPAGVGSETQPINIPPEVAVESPSHVFLQLQTDSEDPVAYDPCRPIHVVMNERSVIAGGSAFVYQALAAAHDATGLEFVVDGFTDEVPSRDRQPYQPDRYGERWAPVLITWSDSIETTELAGDVVGLGGSQSVSDGSTSVYVTGAIELDGPELAEILTRPNGEADVRGVIEHELGHLLGLDHVNDPTQLMNPSTDGSVTTYAAGDLTGLNQLGRGACVPKV